MDGDNLSVMPGAAPFAIDSLAGFPIHNFTGLSDGVYGNSNSWIGDSGSPGFAGIRFDERVTIRSVALGRDNTAQLSDRCLGRYVLQYTIVDSPGELTPEADWIDVGELTYDAACPPLPALRHRYNFPPVEATAIRLLVPGTGIDLGTCIDELEVYSDDGLETGEFCKPPPDLPDLEPAEEGGEFAADNLALAPGAFPFAINSLAGFPIHYFTGLSDGIYGNSNSWIADSGSPGFAGIVLGSRLTVKSIAFGRDNTGQYADRALGRYVLQYTGVDSPSELTLDSDWIDIGEINSTGTCPPLPAVRHRFNFQAVEATAVRLLVPGTGLALGTCIDELEVYADPASVDPGLCETIPELTLMAVGGPINTPALADEVTAYEGGNLARSSAAVPFATPPHPAPNHQIPGLNDGYYGNENSWLGNELGAVSRKVYAGIYFTDGLHSIQAIALGRDNTGALADRADGPYTIEITTDELDPGDDASITSAKWVTIGQASGHLSDGQPALRHVYDLGPVEARALRVRTRLGNAMDEIELLGEPPAPPGAFFHRGDADGNGVLQLTDAIALLTRLFLGGEESRCLEADDADDNGQIQLTDAIRILGFLFLGLGTIPAPGPPSDPCGPDPTGSAVNLGCDSYARC